MAAIRITMFQVVRLEQNVTYFADIPDDIAPYDWYNALDCDISEVAEYGGVDTTGDSVENTQLQQIQFEPEPTTIMDEQIRELAAWWRDRNMTAEDVGKMMGKLTDELAQDEPKEG